VPANPAPEVKSPALRTFRPQSTVAAEGIRTKLTGRRSEDTTESFTNRLHLVLHVDVRLFV